MATSISRGIRLTAAVAMWACLTLTGCGSDSPTAPASASLTGTWVSADREFTWVLTQSGTTVTGTETWANGQPSSPITGQLEASKLNIRVISGQRVVTFLDPPQTVDVGWGAQADVAGNQMTGSIYSIGSATNSHIREFTLRRVNGDH